VRLVNGCHGCVHSIGYAGQTRSACLHPEPSKSRPLGRWIPNNNYVPDWCPLPKLKKKPTPLVRSRCECGTLVAEVERLDGHGKVVLEVDEEGGTWIEWMGRAAQPSEDILRGAFVRYSIHACKLNGSDEPLQRQ
jgi:hypothetical protein